jgi:hypothetical protein
MILFFKGNYTSIAKISMAISEFNASVHLSFADDNAESELLVSQPVSLGLRCISDAQCQAADKNSKCLNGICDCWSNNGSAVPHCSALNPGCYPGTYQV